MSDTEDLAPLSELDPAEVAPRSVRVAFWIKVAACMVSLSITAGLFYLAADFYSRGAVKNPQFVSAQKSEESKGLSQWWSRRADDSRALPRAWGDWVRTDYIGADAIEVALPRLTKLAPLDELQALLQAPPNARRSGAIYTRGPQMILVVIDRYAQADLVTRELAQRPRTFLSNTDFYVLGRRGEANINLRLLLPDDGRLSILGKAERADIERLIMRMNLSLLGVAS